MPQLRDLGNIIGGDLSAAEVFVAYFVKIIMPEPVGVLRLTQYPNGIVANIDGTEEQWSEALFLVRAISTSVDDIYTINAIEFANVDWVYTNYVLQYGMRDREIHVWMGQWDIATGELIDTFKRFEGRTDSSEVDTVYKLILRPHLTPWGRKIPPLIGPACVNPYKDSYSCQYAGSEPSGQTTCDKSRYSCSLRGNLLNFNGFDLLPPAGTIIKVGV